MVSAFPQTACTTIQLMVPACELLADNELGSDVSVASYSVGYLEAVGSVL